MTILITEDSLGGDHVNHEVAHTRLNSSNCSSISPNPLLFLRNSIVQYPAPFVVHASTLIFLREPENFLAGLSFVFPSAIAGIQLYVT